MPIRDLTWYDVVRRNGLAQPDATAIVFDGSRITHGEVLARADALAGGLASAGIVAGDRVAILAQNRPDFVDLLAAVARLGGILLPVNWRLGADEIAYILRDGAPKLVIAEAAYGPILRPLRAELPDVAGWYGFDEPVEGFEPFEALRGQPDGGPVAEPSGERPLVIIHTAAVAGQPRGAVITHANLIAQNVQLALAWSLGTADVALGALPLFHISGLGLVTALQQAGGASVVMQRFDAASAVRTIAAEAVTVTCEFAPMLGQILDAAAGRENDLASLKAIWGLDSPETIDRFEAACPKARFWAGYGQSETSGYVSLSPYRERPGSAGWPAPFAVVGIVDDGGAMVETGTVGEIVVRGPLVFAGYWNRPADNADTMRDGWHHTGDLGRFDQDGYLVYAGRSPAKELIKSGGENVYPAEVERALREHPAILEAVVLGIPDAQWGEAVKAVCQRRPGHDVSASDLIDFVGNRIARYKRPKSVAFVDALPQTPSGAIDRTAVKQDHSGS